VTLIEKLGSIKAKTEKAKEGLKTGITDSPLGVKVLLDAMIELTQAIIEDAIERKQSDVRPKPRSRAWKKAAAKPLSSRRRP